VRVRLLYADRELAPRARPDPGAPDRERDLELGVLYTVMAGSDPVRRVVVPRVLAEGLTDPDAIRYRQEVLADCLGHGPVVQSLYGLAVRGLAAERAVWGFGNAPSSVIYRGTRLLRRFLPLLRELRAIAEAHRSAFASRGFLRGFDEVLRELDPAFFEAAEAHAQVLEFPTGVLLSASLGPGNRGARYELHRPSTTAAGWWRRLLPTRRSPFAFELDDHDESGHRALSRLTDRGLAGAAHALGRANAHILGYFAALRDELSFYLACLDLHARLAAAGAEVSMPEPVTEPDRLSAGGLYDPTLVLRGGAGVVPNDLTADGRPLLVITGANQGGKTTFLRGLGLAQLLMQAGCFVPARRWTASVAPEVLTHFKREEDTALASGKLDEELGRMAALVGRVRPGSLVLLNESFASTNEREGSILAGEIVRAFLDSGVRVAYVTHLYDLADRLLHQEAARGLFLRAERLPDGRRTYRMVVGSPLRTSFAADVFREVFGEPVSAASETPSGEPRAMSAPDRARVELRSGAARSGRPEGAPEAGGR